MVRAVRLATGILCSAVCALCQTPAGPTIGIFLDFESAPGERSVETMKKEVDSLLRPSGVSINWRLAGASHGDESFASLVVLKFSGKCGIEAGPPGAFPPGETHALASTRVDHGHVLPFSEVKCDEVKQALSYLPYDAGRIERQNALGLAMGRVVAHELYHVLARTTAHAGRGLARAAESLQDLVSRQGMPFRAEDSEAIRRAVSQ
jgi:hypothetical protein